MAAFAWCDCYPPRRTPWTICGHGETHSVVGGDYDVFKLTSVYSLPIRIFKLCVSHLAKRIRRELDLKMLLSRCVNDDVDTGDQRSPLSLATCFEVAAVLRQHLRRYHYSNGRVTKLTTQRRRCRWLLEIKL